MGKSLQQSHFTDFLILQGVVGLIQEVFFWLEILCLNGSSISLLSSTFLNSLMVVLILFKGFLHLALK